VSTSLAWRQGITYDDTSVYSVGLGSRGCTEGGGGATSDWGQETLPRSMNESRLFLALIQQHRYHSHCTLAHTQQPQTLWSDSPPNQQSSEYSHNRLYFHIYDSRFHHIFFFSGARQTALQIEGWKPGILPCIRLQNVVTETRSIGIRCLAVNNRGSYVGLNIDSVMKASGDTRKEIARG
jgi:hypothetical protein